MTIQPAPVDVATTQLASIQRRFAEARLESTNDGQRLLVVPHIPLPPGWNKDEVTVRVIVPAGFPHVKPDCFYTEADLRLRTGAEPVNGALQAVFGGQYRWFSWHINTWDPTSGSLDQYLRVCEQRFKDLR